MGYTLVEEIISPAERHSTGMERIDRMLGGGLVKGAVYLVYGEPGVGKTTFLMEVLYEIGRRGDSRVCLASSEEKLASLEDRAKRLGLRPGRLAMRECISVDEVVADGNLAVIGVDTINMLLAPGYTKGSTRQLEHVVKELRAYANKHRTTVIAIAHATKDGDLRGPASLTHLVDAVIALRRADRFVETDKNRYANDLGVVPLLFEALGFFEA